MVKKQKNKLGKDNTFNLCPIKSFYDDIIEYPTYNSKVLEIFPISFDKKADYLQDEIIDTLSFSFPQSMGRGDSIHIVKLERPYVFDDRINQNSIEKNEILINLLDEGKMTEKEFITRNEILNGTEEIIMELNKITLMEKHYYYQIFSESKSKLEEMTSNAETYCEKAGLKCKRLKGSELAVYLKNHYTPNFDEREFRDYDKMNKDEIVKFIMPKSIKINKTNVVQDGQDVAYLDIREYPDSVNNAWLNNAFRTKGVKGVIQINTRDRDRSVKDIDRGLRNLDGKEESSRHKYSEDMDLDTHKRTLKELLSMIKNGNEILLDCSISFGVYDQLEDSENKNDLIRVLGGKGIIVTENYFKQEQGFLAMQPSRYKSIMNPIGMPSTTVAAAFPFVKYGINDENGVFIGEAPDSTPIFFDMWRRDDDHVNSNMMIIGKSGGGKSYFAKGIGIHSATMDSIVLSIDPEAEYVKLVRNLGGDNINVGSGVDGIINPFQIIPQLQEEDENNPNEDLLTKSNKNAYYDHMMFLPAFFKLILDGITQDAIEFLGNEITVIYDNFKITEKTDVTKLKNTEFPTFNNVYQHIKDVLAKAIENKASQYELENYRKLEVYLRKFADKGSCSLLWNGYTSIKNKSRFINFNFQQLLENKNDMIQKAQITLVLRMINKEIISNLTYNKANGTNRKIVVMIDEAHVFIDAKSLLALNFIKDLAKRIRKYGGALIVLTQNVKDFVQTGEIAVKSAAIMNNCQSSFIFRLGEQDINDLQDLYSSNPFNEEEVQAIKTASLGSAFAITSPYERTEISVIASPQMAAMY